MSKKSTIQQGDVLRIAELANISLTDKEIDKYLTQLTETISYVENLDELDTSGVEPTSHSTNQEDIFEDGTPSTRTFSKEQALSNAKKTKSSMFVVPRIME